jgi:hypothetical protein
VIPALFLKREHKPSGPGPAPARHAPAEE